MNPSPRLIGRSDRDELSERASTLLTATVRHEFVGGACGIATADVHRSVDGEDRGGVVVALRVDDHGSAMLPWARVIPRGVELHFAGDDEADALCAALVQALALRNVHAKLVGSAISVAEVDP